MSKGIIHNIGKVVELENPERVERHNFSDEQPTVADLVIPGTEYKFPMSLPAYSGWWGESEISHETVDDKRGTPAFRISS